MLSNKTLEYFVEQQQSVINILNKSNERAHNMLKEAHDECDRLVAEKTKFILAIRAVAEKVDKIPLSKCCLYGADIIDMFREEGVW